jgi:hypothetical protein
MADRSKLHDLIHEIIDHLDLSPRHREELHQTTDDHFDPDGETTAPVEVSASDQVAEAAPLSDREAKIAALKAQLAERAQDEEIAALQAQLAIPASVPEGTVETAPEGA